MKGARSLRWALLSCVLCACAVPNTHATEVPDSLLAFLEGEDLAAASFLSDRLFLQDAGFPRITFPQTEKTEQVAFDPGRIIWQSELKGTPDTHHPALFNRAYLRRGAWEAGAILHRTRGEVNAADLWRAFVSRDEGPWKVVAGDFGVETGLGWTIGSRPAPPFAWRSRVASLRFAEPVEGRLSRETGRGWKGLAGTWTAEWYALRAWAGAAAYDARSGDGGLVVYASQGDHSGPSRDTVQESIGGGSFTVQGERISGSVTGWIDRWSDAPAKGGQPARFEGLAQSNAGLGAMVQYRGDGVSLQSEVSGWDARRLGGVVQGGVEADDWHGQMRVYAAAPEFQALHARPFLPFGSDPRGRLGVSLGAESGSDPWRYGFLWAQDRVHASMAGLQRGDTRRAGRFYVRYTNRYELRWESKSDDLPGQRSWHTGMTGIARFALSEDSRLQMRTQWLPASERGTGYVVAGKWTERVGTAWRYEVVLGYANVPAGHPGVILPAPVTTSGFPIRRATSSGLKFAMRIEAEPLPGLQVWTMIQSDRYDEYTLIEEPSLQPRSVLLHVGLAWRQVIAPVTR
jgi:hypothetical protein